MNKSASRSPGKAMRTHRKSKAQRKEATIASSAPDKDRTKYEAVRLAQMSAALEDEDARRRAKKYFLSVMENTKASEKRRDESAFCLAKILATASGRYVKPEPKAPVAPSAGKPRGSTYVSKKKQAQEAATTASSGSPWEGLVPKGKVNGASHADDGKDEDDQDDDA